MQRLKFPKDLGLFHGEDWLGPDLFMPFMEPAVIACKFQGPTRWSWPDGKSLVWKELLTLFTMWRNSARLSLVKGPKPVHQRICPFNVNKNADED